ncbi:MAG: VCBS repeat-containing protein [Candidatus Latescibacteria bacterium]|jgi:hypothetical protein|nr:VCBS repeat-containing protein [Candidatus Latescibacterota bacterium]
MWHESQFFNGLLGAWYYNDGRYRWLYDLMRRGQEWEDAFEHLTVGKLGGWEVYHGFFYKDVPHVEPVDLLGVRVAMLDRPIYELALHDIRKRAGRQADPAPDIDVSLEEAFDKLSFRRSFDRRSEYVLFNGPTGFAHCHEDGNAIIRLCWNDRIWLADLDPIRRLARYHNSVVIAKDGACNPKPLQTALKAMADFKDWGYSRTRLSPDNGTCWDRNVFWCKGRYFLVIDTVEALDAGSFQLDCIWRVLGEVRSEGSRLDVEQKGERFHIVEADAADRRLTDREADYGFDWETNWQGYPHANQTVHMWHQTKRASLERGARTAYLNLLYPSSDDERQTFSVEQVGESVARVRDEGSGEAMLLGTADDRLQAGTLTVEAKLFRVDASGFSLVDGTALSCRNPLFRSWDPVSIELDLEDGDGLIQGRHTTRVGLRAQDIRLDGKAVDGKGEGGLTWFTVPVGRHRIQVEPGSEGMLARCVGSAEPYEAGYVPARRPAVPRRGLEPVWQAEVGSRVKTASWDGAGQMLVGTSEGTVHLLSETGEQAWSFEAESEIRDVHLADIDGDGVSEAILGTRESRLAVLSDDGSLRWDHVFPPGGSKIRLQRLMKVCTADLEGDGRVQILAGTEGWLLHAFEPDGTLRWETEIRYWAVTGLLPVDLNGDGKDELLIGTEYYAINCFNPDGSFRWIQNTGCVGPTILTADLNGDGEPEVVYGDWRAISAVGWDKGSRLWRVNMGGETEDIAIADVDGDGRPEVVAGSDIGQLVCVRGDGEVAWRRDLLDKITWLTALDGDGDGKDEVVVGFDTGELRVYDGEGRVIAGRRMDEEVTVLRTAGVAGEERIVCATAAGTITAMKPTW